MRHSHSKAYYRSRKSNLASTKGVAYAVPFGGNKPTGVVQPLLGLDDTEVSSFAFDLTDADGSTPPLTR